MSSTSIKSAFQVEKLNLYGNPNVGVYVAASDSYAIIPEDAEAGVEKVVMEVLKVDRVVRVKILDTRLVGVMVAGNSNGLLLPQGAEDEARFLGRVLSVNVALLPSRNNALGNLIVANDKAALVYPGLEREAVKTVEDVLGVEVFKSSIAGIGAVGSIIVVTNRGGIVHPEASEEELRFLEDIFKVPFETGTINFGIEFVRTGLVANSYGALVGEDTTGPEIARIQIALGGGVGSGE